MKRAVTNARHTEIDANVNIIVTMRLASANSAGDSHRPSSRFRM